MKLNNVKKLTCSHFGKPNNCVSENDFIKVLTAFPNIKYLLLFIAFINCDANKIKEIYSNLKGLALDCGPNLFNKSLINIYGSNLSYLRFLEYNNNLILVFAIQTSIH